MKKKILFIAAILGASFGSIAQEEEAEKVFTPEAGDWVIGFDAAPALNYFGNMFNGTIGNSLNTDFTNSDNVLFGKYYKDATTAYRGSLRIMNYSFKNEILVDTNTMNSAASNVIDERKQSGSLIQIGGGLEMRKGEGRFQGYYGGELMVTLGGGTNDVYTYGVALDTNNMMSGGAMNNRTISTKTAGGFGLGIRGFAGVEYFILPKISLGAEFGWGFGMQSQGAGETVSEHWGFDGTAAAIAGTETLYEVTTVTAKSSSMVIDTDNIGGNIKLLFHF